jgi:release factor glutamine methyltransferase
VNVQELRIAAPDIEPMRGVYRPSADSLLLAEAFAMNEPQRRLEVLDVCCGSGFQGIAAALRGHLVDAVDSDKCATINARRNALLNVVQLRVLRGDLFAPVIDRRYDAVLANPPYLPTPPKGVRRHVWCDGGPDGRVVIDRICREVSAHLNPGGSLWMVQSSLADIPRSKELLREAGLFVSEVAERIEPFGPVTNERLDYLESVGLVAPDDSYERLVVLQATLTA